MNPLGYLLIGEVAKPHGLRGQIKVHSYASSPDSFSKGRRVFLGRGEGVKEWVIAKTSSQGAWVLLSLQGLENRQQAEALAGFSIYLREEQLEVLPEGEYYWYQLIGCRVYNDQDQFLGVLDGILSTAAHDIWAVRDGENEILLPAVEEFIFSVDKGKKEIRVRSVEGLTVKHDH